MKEVIVIGAGLAGCEASYQLAKRGIKVKLFESKPQKKSEAHTLDSFAELVCSNSLRSNDPLNAVGLLKEEMRILDSLILKAAEETKVKSGSSLSVDRVLFSNYITKVIKNHPNIEVINEEVTSFDLNLPTIIATGPLTSEKLSNYIGEITDKNYLYFYDAVAPIVEKDSIDFNYAYYKSRYSDEEGDYINCPLSKDEFLLFYQELINAKKVELKTFEKEIFFEGCMPFEEMAARGFKTLLYGPMKPVGLEYNGKKPYAVVQLRQDNAIATLYNIVGFQTHLTFPEQKRILSLVPALKNVEIVRYGVMHRNTYLNSPKLLNNFYQLISNKNIFFAGQITGVEGYVESAASGLCAGINMYQYLTKQKIIKIPSSTMIGSMSEYISNDKIDKLTPMNANFGIFKVEKLINHKEKREEYYKLSMENIEKYLEELNG